MAHVLFSNVGLDIPIFNANSRSLKTTILKAAAGGAIRTQTDGHVVVGALRGVSFKFSDGERVGLVGHNGAGKSTLLRVLSDVYKPTIGSVQIEGEVASLIDVSLGIDPEATGRENIFLRATLLGMSRIDVCRQIDEIIEFSELGEFIDMPVRTYSSGMHLRLASSVSTAVRPEILLMDEWLAVGDESFRHKVEARVSEMVNSTKLLVIASHSRDLIMKVCNRVLWLEHGAVKMDGSPGDVCAAYFK